MLCNVEKKMDSQDEQLLNGHAGMYFLYHILAAQAVPTLVNNNDDIIHLLDAIDDITQPGPPGHS